MLRLIKAEIFKLFKNKTFKVLCVVAIMLSIFMMVMSSGFMEQVMMDSLGDIPAAEKDAILQQVGAISGSEEVITPGSLGMQLSAKDPMNPTALEIYHSSFGSGLIEVLIGILIAGLFAKEYTEGTIKNTLAYGKKRWEFYIAKFLAMIIGTVVLMTILTLISTIGCTIIEGWGEPFEMVQIFKMITTFIVTIMANSAVIAILMIVAICVKSNGGTIGITVGVFVLVPTFLSFLYGVYPWFDKLYELTPFYNSALATSIYATNGDLLKSVFISLITVVLSLIAGIQIFKSQDIK